MYIHLYLNLKFLSEGLVMTKCHNRKHFKEKYFKIFLNKCTIYKLVENRDYNL